MIYINELAGDYKGNRSKRASVILLHHSNFLTSFPQGYPQNLWISGPHTIRPSDHLLLSLAIGHAGRVAAMARCELPAGHEACVIRARGGAHIKTSARHRTALRPVHRVIERTSRRRASPRRLGYGRAEDGCSGCNDWSCPCCGSGRLTRFVHRSAAGALVWSHPPDPTLTQATGSVGIHRGSCGGKSGVDQPSPSALATNSGRTRLRWRMGGGKSQH